MGAERKYLFLSFKVLHKYVFQKFFYFVNVCLVCCNEESSTFGSFKLVWRTTYVYLHSRYRMFSKRLLYSKSIAPDWKSTG